MYHIHTTNTAHSSSSSNSTPTTPTRHTRKLSHVKFGKKPSYCDEIYRNSSSLVIPFDDSSLTKKLDSDFFDSHKSADSIIHSNISAFTDSRVILKDDLDEIAINNNKTNDIVYKEPHPSSSSSIVTSTRKSTSVFKNNCQSVARWLLTFTNLGPFTKQGHWPLCTYLIVAFAIVIFSGQLILSKQSSGEFIELNPFNYMIGPSNEILIQTGARFSPCMRSMRDMPPDRWYVCLNTFLLTQQHKTPAAAAAAAALESLKLLDPITMNNETTLLANDGQMKLLNESCTLSTICGMTVFHQSPQAPDQTYRVLSSLFVHSGVIQLCFNLAALMLIGSRVERALNATRFSLLFLGSGLFGQVLGANFAPVTIPYLGCSASIFGIFGYLYVDLLVNWKGLEKPIQCTAKLILCTLFAFILNVFPYVDIFTHIGGFVAGIILGLSLVQLPTTDSTVNNNSILIGKMSSKDMEKTIPPFPPKPKNRKKKIGLYLFRLLIFCIYAAILGVLFYRFSTTNSL